MNAVLLFSLLPRLLISLSPCLIFLVFTLQLSLFPFFHDCRQLQEQQRQKELERERLDRERMERERLERERLERERLERERLEQEQLERERQERERQERLERERQEKERQDRERLERLERERQERERQEQLEREQLEWERERRISNAGKNLKTRACPTTRLLFVFGWWSVREPANGSEYSYVATVSISGFILLEFLPFFYGKKSKSFDFPVIVFH